jgi:hypothetical protein
VVYIGRHRTSLRRRVEGERRDAERHNPETHWIASVIHTIKLHNATCCWIETRDADEAALLEKRLIEWHRACTNIAPLAVGWASKSGTPQGEARAWARDLWNRNFA